MVGAGRGISYPPPPAEAITPCYGTHRAAWLEQDRVQQTTVYPPLLSQPLPALPLNPTPYCSSLHSRKTFLSFSRVNMHPVSRLSFPVLSLHFSHISLFSLSFPPSLPPLLCSHVCVVHLSLPRLLTLHHPPHWDGPLSHSCLKQSTASAFPIFTFRQHSTKSSAQIEMFVGRM